jgi:hypothetical protein
MWWDFKNTSAGKKRGGPRASVRKRRPRTRPFLEELEPLVTPTGLTDPIQAYQFDNSIGVNTHFLQGDPNYKTNYTQLKADLQALGIYHVRDEFVNPGGRDEFNDVLDLASVGIKHQTTEYTYTAPANQMPSLLAPLAGAIEGVEGINEPEYFQSDLTAADIFNYQQALYTSLKATPLFGNIPVLAPSLVTWGMSHMLAPNTQYRYPIENFSDYGNAHPYPNDHMPPETSGSITTQLNDVARVAVPDKPTMSTETDGTDGAFNPTVDGFYTPRLLMYLYQQGSVRNYYYELLNEGDGYGGLFQSDAQTPNPAGYDIKHMIGPGGILYDRSNFRTTPLDYSWAGGDTSNLQSQLFETHDGTYELALWRSVSVGTWNGGNSWLVDIPIPTNVTVSVNNAQLDQATMYTDLGQQNITTADLPVSNNQITVRVGAQVVFVKLTTHASTNPNDAWAVNASLVVTPGNTVVFPGRTSDGGGATTIASATGISGPVWLELPRAGNQFYAFYSTNGSSWNALNSDPVTRSSTADVGLAVSAHTARGESPVDIAQFSHVQVTDDLGDVSGFDPLR